MAMDQETLDRVFKYRKNTDEQDEDLTAVYRDAKQLAETIQRCVSPKYAEMALGQLAGVLGVCRNAIESDPRQSKPILLV